MGINVRPVVAADRDAWLAMRSDLWPKETDEHGTTIAAFFASGTPHVDEAYVAEDGEGHAIGFIELRLRDYAEGSNTVPVPYVEGWFVKDAWRRRGVGRALIKAAEAWARSVGCRELASDAELTNAASIAAHEALGFVAVERAVHFLKRLAKPG